MDTYIPIEFNIEEPSGSKDMWRFVIYHFEYRGKKIASFVINVSFTLHSYTHKHMPQF